MLLDGGFVRKRFRQVTQRAITASEVRPLAERLLDPRTEELFRVYFYDCAPSEDSTTHPISGKPLNLRSTRAYRDNSEFQEALGRTEQVALRKGELAFRGWRLTPGATRDLIQNGPRTLRDDDVEMNLNQKGIDMEIGLDVAWFAVRRIVDRIVLCTGDRDFVPAMKLARREGVQVILATLGATAHATLLEYADFIRPCLPAALPDPSR